MLQRLSEHQIPAIPYSETLETELVENKFWMEKRAVVIPSPLHWIKLARRPSTVLISVHPKLTAADLGKMSAENHQQYTLEMLEARATVALNSVNFIEIAEDGLGSIARVLEHTNRPRWPNYFMQIAQAVSLRSNCMKRRVGAVLVKNHRVIATGYNGTATGSLNCANGGCKRCNNNTKQGAYLSDCFCIHAEESAYLDAGAEKCAGAELYTTVFPCIQCSRKTIQLQVAKVYYIHDYIDNDDIREHFRRHSILIEQLKE